MKKRIILLPIMMLALAACNSGNSGSTEEPASTEPASVTETSTTPAPVSTQPNSTEPGPNSTEPGPAFVLPEGLAHKGTEADPFSVADARKVAEATGETATEDSYYIAGVVQSVNASGVAQYGNININMVDEGGTDVFQAFQIYGIDGAKFTDVTAAEVVVGAKVVVVGPIVNYKGNTPETTGKGTAHLVSVEKGEVPEFKLPEDLDHEGTEADPFSVADALKVAEVAGGTVTVDDYYVKGEIKSVNASGVAQYGNADVVIKDADVDNEFTLFRLLDVDGAKFTADSAAKLVVGEELVAVGKIKTHTHTSGDTTPEMDQGCHLISVTETEHDPVAVESVEVESAELQVEVGKSVALGAKVMPENADDKELIYDVDVEDVVEIKNDKVKGLAEGTVVITVKAHGDESKTATITVTVLPASEEPGEETRLEYDFSAIPNASDNSALTDDAILARFTENVVEGVSIVTAVTGAEVVYDAKNSEGPNVNGLKLGSSKANGKFTMTTSVEVKQVIVTFASWRDDVDSIININGVEVASKAKAAQETLTIELEEASSELALTSTNRSIITKIVFVY